MWGGGNRSDIAKSRKLAVKKLSDEIEGDLRLVHRDEVSSAADLHEGEALVGLVRPNLFPANDVRRVGRGIETRLPWPLECVGPHLPAHPVDDEVLVAEVDEDGHTRRQKRREVLLEAEHPVPIRDQFEFHDAVAARPLLLLPA